jgi:hypothetical protein
MKTKVGLKGLSCHLPLSVCVCVCVSLSHSSSFYLRLPLLIRQDCSTDPADKVILFCIDSS